MGRQLIPAVRMLIVMTVLTGLLYPLAVTVLAEALFPWQADGSPLVRDGELVGSALIGQQLADPSHFHPRPSASGYDPTRSTGSNLGPGNPDLLAAVADRAAAYREVNGLPDDAPLPVDAVTASASGLDPHISVANARLQAARVAAARGMDVAGVLALIDEHTVRPQLGILNEPAVNVLILNLVLEAR